MKIWNFKSVSSLGLFLVAFFCFSAESSEKEDIVEISKNETIQNDDEWEDIVHCLNARRDYFIKNSQIISAFIKGKNREIGKDNLDYLTYGMYSIAEKNCENNDQVKILQSMIQNYVKLCEISYLFLSNSLTKILSDQKKHKNLIPLYSSDIMLIRINLPDYYRYMLLDMKTSFLPENFKNFPSLSESLINDDINLMTILSKKLVGTYMKGERSWFCGFDKSLFYLKDCFYSWFLQKRSKSFFDKYDEIYACLGALSTFESEAIELNALKNKVKKWMKKSAVSLDTNPRKEIESQIEEYLKNRDFKRIELRKLYGELAKDYKNMIRPIGDDEIEIKIKEEVKKIVHEKDNKITFKKDNNDKINELIKVNSEVVCSNKLYDIREESKEKYIPEKIKEKVKTRKEIPFIFLEEEEEQEVEGFNFPKIILDLKDLKTLLKYENCFDLIIKVWSNQKKWPKWNEFEKGLETSSFKLFKGTGSSSVIFEIPDDLMFFIPKKGITSFSVHSSHEGTRNERIYSDQREYILSGLTRMGLTKEQVEDVLKQLEQLKKKKTE